MRILKQIALFALLITGLYSCDDEFKPNIPKGRIEEIAFEKDTFIFNEAAGNVNVSILATKYVNYATKIKVKIIDGTAVQKKNFFVDDTQVKMALGSAEIGIGLAIVNDTIINESRKFEMQIESIEGGGVAAKERQSCVVIIRNDDYIPEAAVQFDEKKMTFDETQGAVKVPFHLTKKAKGNVIVEFAVGKDDRQTAESGVHFKFKNDINKIELKEGTLKGELDLEMIDDDIPEGEKYFDLVVRKVEGALIGLDSLVKVVINDDDLDRTVKLTELTEGKTYNEDDGTIEIPMVFAGGKSSERMIRGKIVVDSIFGCERTDFTIENAEFETKGDETINLKIKLKDNDKFGEWGFRLVFRDIHNVRALDKNFIVNIKDDERELSFENKVYEVNEGESVSIKAILKGGKALMDIPLELSVVEGETDADPSQYELPKSTIKMYKGFTETDIVIKTIKHNSRADKKLRLRISTSVGKESPKKVIDKDVEVDIIIRNTDASIGFGIKDYGDIVKSGTEVEVPISVAGVKEGVLIYFETETDMAATDYNVSSNFIRVPKGETSGMFKFRLNRIQDVHRTVKFKIVRVVMDESGENNDLINPEIQEKTIDIKGLEDFKVSDIGVERIDRSAWKIDSFSTEEPSGEGANNGRAIHMIDGNEGTFWHTQWKGNKPPNPHTLVVDMNEMTLITGADLRRRSGNSDTKKVVVEVSEDKENWVMVGTISEFNGNDGSVRTEGVKAGRYVRLTVTGRGDGVASISEFYLTGKKW